MSDEDFSFQIKADPSQALAAADQVTASVVRMTGAFTQAGKAIDEGFRDSQGRFRDAQGRFLAVGMSAQDAGGKMKEMGDKGEEAGKKIAKGADDAHSSVMGLVAAAAAYVTGHQLMDLADGYTEIGNRLRVVAKDTDNFNGLMDATFAISQETRIGWDAVTNTYQRLSNVTKGLGLSQKEVLALTDEMAKGAKVSGANTQEASAAMSELNHAFATGSLQGREYRVLMRDVPALMHELQVASGKTGSEFAEMGKHGKVTGQLLIDWFAKASDSINEKFGKVVPTIADEFTKIHNAAEKFFGETATGTGILNTIKGVLDYVATHFETFGKILLGVGQAIVGLYVINKVIGLVQLLNAAIAANPFMALIVVITTVVMLLRQFGDQINIDSGGVAKMSDVLAVLWGYIKDIAASIYEFLDGAWHALSSAFSDGIDATGIELSLKNVLIFIAGFVDAGIGIFKLMGHAIAGVFAVVVTDIENLFGDMINAVIDAINKILSIGNSIGDMAAMRKQRTNALERWHDSNADGAMPDAAAKKQIEASAQYEFQASNMGGSAPSIGHVDLGGDSHKVWDAMKEDMNQDLQTSTTKDLVNKFFDDVEKHAAERVKNTKPPTKSYVDEAKGNKDAPPVDEKAMKALEKLYKELEGVVSESNPIDEALIKIAKAQEVVNHAMASGSPKIQALLAQYGGGAAIMDTLRKKLEDQIHPFEAMITKLLEEAAVLQMSTEAQKRANDVEKVRNELKQKGVTATEAQINEVIRLTNAIEAQKEVNKAAESAYTKLFGAQKNYAMEQAGLNQLLAQGRINGEQYAEAIDKARLAYLEGSEAGRTFSGGAEAAFLTLKRDMTDVGGAIKKTLIGAFDAVQTALDDFITKGTVDWHKMVESMLLDLTHLIEKQLISAAISAASGGDSGTGGAAVAAAATLATAAGGNQWTVGGSGGAQDSQVVAFRASPGERVTVDHGPNTGSLLNDDAPRSSGGGPVTIHVLNDPKAIVAAMGHPAARQVMLTTFQKGQKYVKQGR